MRTPIRDLHVLGLPFIEEVLEKGSDIKAGKSGTPLVVAEVNLWITQLMHSTAPVEKM